MNVWIYDENSYPSELPVGMCHRKYLSLIIRVRVGFDKGRITAGGYSPLLHVFKKENDAWKDITDQIADYKGTKGRILPV